MEYFFKSSFVRLFKKLDPFKKKQAIEAMEALKVVLQSGQNYEGLGLKRLSRDLWEIRSSLKYRILFTYVNAEITFVLIGDHDEVDRYLKSE